MDYNRESRRQKALYTLLLCAAGLAINVFGVRLVRALHLPIYLDNVGSALTAALGGFIPGILVGFLTNIINGIGDLATTYYGSLTVLIAVAAAWYAARDFFTFKKPWRLLAIIGTFALIGGGLGSVLTWALYGMGFGDGVSAPLAHRIYEAGRLNVFWSQFAADMIIDVLDKTITVLLVTTVLCLLPTPIKEHFYYSGWQQAPLAAVDLDESNRIKSKGISLRSKIILLVATAMIVIAAVVTFISYIYFTNASKNEQLSLANSVVDVVVHQIDGDRVDEFLAQGEAAEGYREIEDRLQNMMESSEYIEYIYVYRIEEDGCHVVFDPDTPDTPGEDPGTVIDFDEAFRDYLPALLAGEEIEPVTSNETYGWLLTIYKPVYDSQGVCQCYAAADISMDHIARDGYQFLARVLSLFFGFFVLLLTLAIWLAEYNVILPINSMAIATGLFAYDSESARADTVECIRQLDIRTGDEIENLYHSVAKTTQDMVETVANVEHQNEVISKLQNGLILVLADMVESRDKCTGDHVRKTAAYTDIIMRQLKKDGVYTDQLTDAFMYDVVNSAPLHDIGKIQVSDAILNKPGKLTDEEFAVMKTHTTAGAEVIEHAMYMVSEDNSGYLREAMNLAHYHHEKWNGMGYPSGLKGEQIPLSARIMAVADVFDALVSKRSYKDGFPFEKAMAIIQEGSGSHFDPNIVRAFVNASDEVRRVMETNMGMG